MVQRFIELGKGYADLYELFELAERMPERVEHFISIHSVGEQSTAISLALIMQKTRQGEFQPIYICLEGIPYSPDKTSKRYQQFEQIATKHHKNIVELAVKSSAEFHEKELYFQYITSILRMNRLLQPYF